jgi:hypothetical protein
MTGSARTCAYCQVGTDLTNEHIFPECIYDRVPGGQITSIARTPKGDKAVDSRPTICDVCARCNNQVLSALDTYICELHDRYFRTFIHAGDRIDFRFDFDLLLRWLLKTAYNTARSRAWHFQKDPELLKYLTGEGPRPNGFHLYLILVIPTPVSAIEWEVVPANATEVPPHPGSANLLNVQGLPGISQGYLVSLNSYYFYIFREIESVSVYRKNSTLKRLLKFSPGARELFEDNRAVLFSSPIDFMQHMKNNEALSVQTQLARKHVEKKKKGG